MVVDGVDGQTVPGDPAEAEEIDAVESLGERVAMLGDVAHDVSELIANSFGCGLDSMQRFLDAAAKLLVARDGQFGYPVSDRAPQKTVGLNHLGAGTDLPKFVAPQTFLPGPPCAGL